MPAHICDGQQDLLSGAISCNSLTKSKNGTPGLLEIALYTKLLIEVVIAWAVKCDQDSSRELHCRRGMLMSSPQRVVGCKFVVQGSSFPPAEENLWGSQRVAIQCVVALLFTFGSLLLNPVVISRGTSQMADGQKHPRASLHT